MKARHGVLLARGDASAPSKRALSGCAGGARRLSLAALALLAACTGAVKPASSVGGDANIGVGVSVEGDAAVVVGRDGGPGGTVEPTAPIPAGEPGTESGVWSALSVMQVVNPMNFKAAGNGTTDDLSALNATVNALPASGGIVFFPPGRTFKKTNLLTITKSHVKLWSANRQAEIFQSVNGQRRRQSILCRGNTGCGVFGLKLRSDATARFDALEDNQISADKATLIEIAGVEIQGSAATGMFLNGSKEHYIEGNYVHGTWADHIHHTAGASASWVWGNYIFNEAPSRGDDGVACVTYGPNSARCGDMEWWGNTILHTDWGRGFSVIGGENIKIHHNWAIGVAGAGVIVASENAYDTSASKEIAIANNFVTQCGHTIRHPGILVSGLSSSSGPLTDITLNDNVSVANPMGAYRAEGSYMNVTNTNLSSATSALPMPMPSETDVRMADTSILRTRDTSHVAANMRPGLYRIHVRQNGAGFQQRFEYMVKGAPDAIAGFALTRKSAGDYLSEQRTVDGMAYALFLCAAPVQVPSGITAVTFRELREKDGNGTLSWLWERVDKGKY